MIAESTQEYFDNLREYRKALEYELVMTALKLNKKIGNYSFMRLQVLKLARQIDVPDGHCVTSVEEIDTLISGLEERLDGLTIERKILRDMLRKQTQGGQ